MNRLLPLLLALGILSVGCSEKTTAPVVPPAAPRGLFSVTGDQQVTLVWLANTEPDVTGYRIYQANCGEPDCLYTRIAAVPVTTGSQYEEYVVTGLRNGETHFFAVAAVNRAGAEGDLSYDNIFDTPRPAGTGVALNNFRIYFQNIGYDFSTSSRTNTLGSPTDIFFGYFEDSTGVAYQQIFATYDPAQSFVTDIQDMGFVTSLDQVDFAPDSGWSPTGTVEAIAGHAYVVWTSDNHFAKIRVTNVQPARITFDWAYQTSPGNRELLAIRPRTGVSAVGPRPIVWLRH